MHLESSKLSILNGNLEKKETSGAAERLNSAVGLLCQLRLFVNCHNLGFGELIKSLLDFATLQHEPSDSAPMIFQSYDMRCVTIHGYLSC
jgi:hypothetical protein